MARLHPCMPKKPEPVQHYIGLDVGKRFTYGTVLNRNGEKVKEGRFPSTPEGLEGFLQGVKRAKAVVEACGFWWPIYNHLEQRGIRVSLAHPLKTRAIAEARIKTDRIDSEILAQLLRMDFVPEAYVPPAEIRELRQRVRHRIYLVHLRTAVKNRIHALLAMEGVEGPEFGLFTRKGVRFLRSLQVPSAHRIASCLSLLEALDGEVAAAEERFDHEGEEVDLLTSIPGIGRFAALLILSEIGEVSRFPGPKALCSYAGLVPSVHQSGDTRRMGSITRLGSPWLRWILIQCTHAALKRENRFRRFYERVKRRKGAKKAIVATARKMLVIVYMVLSKKRPYDDRYRAGHPVSWAGPRDRGCDWGPPNDSPQWASSPNRCMSKSPKKPEGRR